MEVIKRIAHMCAPYRKHFYVGITALLLACAAPLISPLFYSLLIDDVVGNGRIELLLPLCVAIIALAVLRATMNYLRGIRLETLSQNFTYDLRTRLYKHLQKMPYEFFDKHYVGEIMSRMTGDIEGLRNLLSGGVMQIIENVVWFFGSLIVLFFFEWKLALIMASFAPVVAAVAFLFNKKIRPAWRAVREQNAVLSTKTQETISGIRVVKAFAREEYEKETFRTENRKQLKLILNATWIWSHYIPALEFIGMAMMPVLLFVGGVMVVNGDITLGKLVIFISYSWMITGPMRMLGNLINMLAQAITSADKLFYYLDLGPSIKDRPETVFPKEFKGHVKFDHVFFSYGDGPVLKDVSFEALPGQTVAIMGATGQGKTSVVNLLARFYECAKGAVTIDGVDVKDMPVHRLRDRIGYVNQETFLFSETIANNIAFGRSDASPERIRAAARAAQADEFIQELPQKYETIVGERGMGLSGGQKQRVSIARALLYDPTILVLDDSTSAVDMETEYQIQQELAEIMKGRTTFIIAHRISSVKDADLILVLDDGKIAERGKHAELMAAGGLYARMVSDQYKDFAKINPKEAG